MCVEICRSLFCIIGNFNEFPIIQKSLRAGSHCGGKELCHWSDPAAGGKLYYVTGGIRRIWRAYLKYRETAWQSIFRRKWIIRYQRISEKNPTISCGKNISELWYLIFRKPCLWTAPGSDWSWEDTGQWECGETVSVLQGSVHILKNFCIYPEFTNLWKSAGKYKEGEGIWWIIPMKCRSFLTAGL